MKKIGFVFLFILGLTGIIGVSFLLSKSCKNFDTSNAIEVKGTDEMVRELSNRWLNDKSADWYKGDLDCSNVHVYIVPMKDDEYYHNGITYSYASGETIYLNDTVYVNGKLYNTISLITNNKINILDKVLLHEMIHAYMFQHYPNSNIDNVNHGKIFSSIEDDLIRKGFKGIEYIK